MIKDIDDHCDGLFPWSLVQSRRKNKKTKQFAKKFKIQRKNY